MLRAPTWLLLGVVTVLAWLLLCVPLSSASRPSAVPLDVVTFYQTVYSGVGPMEELEAQYRDSYMHLKALEPSLDTYLSHLHELRTLDLHVEMEQTELMQEVLQQWSELPAPPFSYSDD
jgi:hypothetical protein